MGTERFPGHRRAFLGGSPATCALVIALAGMPAVSCSSTSASGTQEAPPVEAPDVAEEASSLSAADPPPPIGLALDIKNGTSAPLRLHAGRTFYLELVDISTTITSSIDEGVSGLKRSGDFATAFWGGLQYEEEETAQLPDALGRFTRSRFYRGAAWMKAPSVIAIQQLDVQGKPVDFPLIVPIGKDDKSKASDHFFVRRLRAIQRTLGCVAPKSCVGATEFEEEAVVELRNALDQDSTFTLDTRTKALRVRWSANPLHPYVIPVEQVTAPIYDYGFRIDVDTLTPPGPQGYFLPGQELTFRLTLRDGAGNRLHPQGSLPSYNDVLFGTNEAGFQYFQGFFDPTWVFWRRKHRERTFIAHFMGPAQNAQPIHSIVPLDQILTEDVQSVGTLERDGIFDVWKVFPATDDVFGGAFDPTHAGWAVPGSDTFSVQLPSNAPPGSYRMTTKARRVYHGEDIAYTRTTEVQVGTAQQTAPTLQTGNCQTCHVDGGALSQVLHRNPSRSTCYGCHAPLGVEFDAPIHSRVHFLHSRSNRYSKPVDECKTCHLTSASIQRTSKSACMSCHTSYPQDHITNYGPVTSIYVGGGEESFGQCSTTCHTTHEDSGL